MKTKNINNNKKYEIKNFLNPQIVYIPINNSNISLKKGDYVYKGDIVSFDLNKNPIYSSVSGYVTNKIEKTNKNNEKETYLMIENDFKEKSRINLGYHKNISNYTKDEFITLLKECGISNLIEKNVDICKQYNKKIKYLVVDVTDKELNSFCDKSIINKECEKILECIDAIIEINKLKYGFIAVMDNDLQNIEELERYIGSYPRIRIIKIPNIYPIVYDKFLIEYIFGENVYNIIDEKGIIINDAYTILSIYNSLKFCKPITERIISITGDGIKKQMNINVKLGSSLRETINKLIEYKNSSNLLFIINGLVNGKSLPTDDIVITKDLKSIIIINNQKYKTLRCINCGKCAEICPSKIYPSLIMENIDNIMYLKKLSSNKCIECGLCSYVCPSKIEVNEYVKIAKDKVDVNEV